MILPLSFSWPPTVVMPNRSVRALRIWLSFSPSGTRKAVRPSAGRVLKSSRPERLDAGLAGLAHPAMALPDVLDALVLDPPQGRAQGQDQGVGRGVRRVELLHLLAGGLEVEVVAGRVEGVDLGPGLGADRDERQARRHHQGFLRADAEQVDAPFVGPALHGADARDAVDREQGGRLGDDPADRLDRMPGPGRGLAQVCPARRPCRDAAAAPRPRDRGRPAGPTRYRARPR